MEDIPSTTSILYIEDDPEMIDLVSLILIRQVVERQRGLQRLQHGLDAVAF